MKRIKPIKLELKLNKETVRVIPVDQLNDAAGAGGTHKACSVAPWCPAHTC
jgi:hypothetical protein